MGPPAPRGGRALLVLVLLSLVVLLGAAISLSLAWDGPSDPHGYSTYEMRLTDELLPTVKPGTDDLLAPVGPFAGPSTERE